MSFYLLTETRIYRQNPEIEAPEGLQRLASTKVTQEGYTPVSDWVLKAVPFILNLKPKDNGIPLTIS
ncbi:hypothetical protein [Nostoc sp. C052]|uniref:hypothetical protein n=1 Tax=Nostoc sp. C052 TaxID=2576902 RepID=UPI00211882F2|nr:hypothetical protein [Nostoc sp. C052]